MTEPAVGDHAELRFTVTDDDTAIALGSGDVPVLATPRAIAWAEAATVAAAAPSLAAGETTVGTSVTVAHTTPSRVGDLVLARARITGIERRRLEFAVTVLNPDGTAALSGSVQRVRVDRERFGA